MYTKPAPIDPLGYDDASAEHVTREGWEDGGET
jgi:hypothetical protein